MVKYRLYEDLDQTVKLFRKHECLFKLDFVIVVISFLKLCKMFGKIHAMEDFMH